MAFTTFLMTVSLVAMASGFNFGQMFLAGFPGWTDNDNTFPGFPSPLMTLRFAAPPPIPMPSMRFPNLPQPPLYFFNQFPAFPTMPTLQLPKMPTAQDIVNTKPGNGGTYSGVVVTTQTESKRNEDGTLSKTGGTTIITNDGGDVKVIKTGDKPPEVVTNPRPEQNSTNQSFDSDAPKIKPFKPHKFKPFSFNHLHNFESFEHIMPDMEPIDREKIKNYVPGKDEKFTGHSVSSHSSITNINGKIEEQASLSTLNNDNGLVDEKNLAYHKGGTTQ